MSGLDIVIVSYRCRELVRDCLSSLRDHRPRQPMQIYLIDNASGDGTVEMVSAEFPDVDVVAADRNLGFAAGTNCGIRLGQAEYILALNPDTRLTPRTLDQLIEVMDAHPDVGICGPRLVREDGSLDHAAKRSFPTPLGALAHFAGIGRSQYRAPHVEEGSVDAVNGAFMLIRRGMLDQIGLFDEGYWMYMEDLDLCYRAKQAGWLTWYEPHAVAVHVKQGSSPSGRTSRLEVAFHYGMYRFYRRHYAPLRSRLVNAAVYAGISAKLGIALGRTLLRRLAAGGRRRSTVSTAAR